MHSDDEPPEMPGFGAGQIEKVGELTPLAPCLE